MKGDVTLVYPGYTHYPKVGPETLGKLAEATARLGDAAKRVKVLFISVDPKRDTPASPGRYVNAFDAHHDVCATGRRVRSDPQLGRIYLRHEGPREAYRWLRRSCRCLRSRHSSARRRKRKRE
ncbi:SCO family protein [Paraburkholderia hospita]|uniref:SCO family protein n=1 Tax=Paraburkholderia hospita TaxID=169430 RepID=UPI000B348B4C|nr:hypothetical protein CA603_05475 [Paraburkholderia hospita]